MSTITSKVSIQVQSQQPDFIQAEHPDFLQFLKSYYEFMESAELVLSSLGLVASIIQVDGTTSGVTTEWQGGSAPTEGNASAIDAYQYTVIKTGDAAFTVLASITQFA